LVVEAMEDAGVKLGLPREVARGLASQTCLGAGKMLTTSSDTPSELRRKVTSPNGTTQAAIEAMEAGGLREILGKGVHAANDRGYELGQLMGEQV
jgi:pyrroline-5-carboxylate reductase